MLAPPTRSQVFDFGPPPPARAKGRVGKVGAAMRNRTQGVKLVLTVKTRADATSL